MNNISRHQQFKDSYLEEKPQTWWERVRDCFWDLYEKIMPWHSRRRDFLYKLKCYIFRPYTTVKPRYLTHEYCDKTELLPHIIFEVLSQFMEKEKPGEHIDWEWAEEHSHAWKEINELYKWWHEVYIPWTEHHDDRMDTIERVRFEKIEGSNHYELVYSSPEAEAHAHEVMDAINKEEEEMNQVLIENCKRVVQIKDFLWT